MASEVPSTRRNTLSGSWAVGLLAATAATRRMSSSVTSVEFVAFLVISVAWSAHSWPRWYTIGSAPLCVTIGLLCS